VELFTDNVDAVSIDEVTGQLADDQHLLHQYLHALFVKDPMVGFKYHEKQVALYAEYQPLALLAFLKSSNCYLLEDALAICEAKELYAEMVFLLRKMGDLNYALTLLVDKLQDFKVRLLPLLTLLLLSLLTLLTLLTLLLRFILLSPTKLTDLTNPTDSAHPLSSMLQFTHPHDLANPASNRVPSPSWRRPRTNNCGTNSSVCC
jgi:hypothetical protein